MAFLFHLPLIEIHSIVFNSPVFQPQPVEWTSSSGFLAPLHLPHDARWQFAVPLPPKKEQPSNRSVIKGPPVARLSLLLTLFITAVYSKQQFLSFFFFLQPSEEIRIEQVPPCDHHRKTTTTVLSCSVFKRANSFIHSMPLEGSTYISILFPHTSHQQH